jgi:hypothetical protein
MATEMLHRVTVEIDVTAESFEQAVVFALNDLRDTSLGPWFADVQNLDTGEVLRDVASNEWPKPDWEPEMLEYITGEEAADMGLPASMLRPGEGIQFRLTEPLVECGQCGGYHRRGYSGDCRNDSERWPK